MISDGCALNGHGIQINKRFVTYIFSVFITVCFFAWFLLFVKEPLGTQSRIFYAGGFDLFADFFNCCRYVSERDVYFNTTNGFDQKIYLPLVFVFFYPFSRLDDFAHFSLEQCYSSRFGLLGLVFSLLMFSLLIVHSCGCLCDRYKTSRVILIPVLLSSIFIFSIERANIILLAAAFLFYFLAFYDSENRRLRAFAVISIVFASIIKIYPVLFGILYLKKKQYKEIVYSVVLGLLLTFLPFLFFKHEFANISQYLFVNLRSIPGVVNTFFDVSYICYRIGMYLTNNYVFAERIRFIVRIFTIILAILAVVFSFLSKNKVKSLLLITFAVLYLQKVSNFYCALYLIPAVILFFSEKNSFCARDFFLLLYFAVLFMPLRFMIIFKDRNGNVEGLEGNVILVKILSFTALAVCVVVSARELFHRDKS